jgi:hypothetical protein
MTPPIGRLTALVLDCPNPDALAHFYQAIIGGETIASGSGAWVELRANGTIVAFQRIDDHRPPTWPNSDVPQQADVQPKPTEFRVFIDLAGHPYCLVDATSS